MTAVQRMAIEDTYFEIGMKLNPAADPKIVRSAAKEMMLRADQLADNDRKIIQSFFGTR